MPVPGASVGRAHLVEEDERADRRALAMRQGAMDLEPAEIVGGGEQGLEEGIVGHGAILSRPCRRSEAVRRAIAATRGS